jgi:hypothetical protein
VTANSTRCVVAWLLALILVFRAGSAGYGAMSARHWSPTTATIAESDARWVEVPRSVRTSMWSYKLHIRYVYTVGDQTYSGTRAGFSAWGPDDNLNPFNSSTARAFPVGAEETGHVYELNIAPRCPAPNSALPHATARHTSGSTAGARDRAW